MKNSELIQQLMFDWELYTKEEFLEQIKPLPLKLIRYMATHHPDNRIRKWLFRATNVFVGSGAILNLGMVVSDNYEPLLYIGDRVAIAPNLTVICDSNPNKSHLADIGMVKERLIWSKKVEIKQDCWIGANVTILGGVTIGESSIIGAGSVVSKDVEPYSIYAGVPARKINTIKAD